MPKANRMELARALDPRVVEMLGGRGRGIANPREWAPLAPMMDAEIADLERRGLHEQAALMRQKRAEAMQSVEGEMPMPRPGPRREPEY